MVRYKVKPDRVAENEALVVKVYEELKNAGPPGLTYATYKLDDGVSFVHIATVDGETNAALTELAAFKTFTSGIKDRCVEPPTTTSVTRVGAYK
jgi:hypothetical protein